MKRKMELDDKSAARLAAETLRQALWDARHNKDPNTALRAWLWLDTNGRSWAELAGWKEWLAAWDLTRLGKVRND